MSAHIEPGPREDFETRVQRVFHVRALQKIAQIAWTYPGLPLVLTENGISIPSPTADGFAMAMRYSDGRYVNFLGEWSCEFLLPGPSLELLEAALRGEIRLKVQITLDDQRWSAERRSATGQWLEQPSDLDDAEDAPLVEPIRTIYLMNDFQRFAGPRQKPTMCACAASTSVRPKAHEDPQVRGALRCNRRAGTLPV